MWRSHLDEKQKGIYDLEDTATAGELASYFGDLSTDTEVYLNHDNGYAYGSLCIYEFEEVPDEDELEEDMKSSEAKKS